MAVALSVELLITPLSVAHMNALISHDSASGMVRLFQKCLITRILSTFFICVEWLAGKGDVKTLKTADRRVLQPWCLKVMEPSSCMVVSHYLRFCRLFARLRISVE